MEIISNASESVLAILKKFKKTDSANRMMKYCVQTPVDGGILLFNVLTREMVWLTGEEAEKLTEIPELKDRWFVVPQGINEKELASLVRWILETRRKKPEHITSYTIFPTTDCNARCFYCFELGRSRISMSQETALKTLEYIKAHCGGKKVSISWFGGEPLFNQQAIDIICDGLCQAGIEFTSSAVSNGYLFDGDTVAKAVASWNLKKVQITLDGTEQVYNRSKAYIYQEGSPYQVVLENMGRLLDTGVAVDVRLNMDIYNAGDLLALVDELVCRFSGKTGLRVYAHHLFDWERPMAELHCDAEWEKRDEAMQRLEEKIEHLGLAMKPGISQNLRLNHCMADSGKSITITPTGDIGLCEHYSESEFIGHIDREGFDETMVKSWKERTPEVPECNDCFCYPNCIQLKRCASKSICFRQLRQERLRKTQRQMMNEYRRWQSQDTLEESGYDELC